MSVQAISAISSKSGSDDSAVQSDFQVKQIESQIQDWSTCPTTPPEMKKSIVAKLQVQLDSIEKSVSNHENAVKTANQAAASTGGNYPAQSQPMLAPRYVPPFKVDTYV
jgi:hypothetical protein